MNVQASVMSSCLNLYIPLKLNNGADPCTLAVSHP